MKSKVQLSLLFIAASLVLAGCFSEVGDFVWEDLDRDGVQDAGEPGLENVTVNIYEGTSINSGLRETTTTNASGSYFLVGLDRGDYTVEFVPPSGYMISPQDATIDDADSDPDPSSGLVYVKIFGEDDTLEDVDAGMFLIPEASPEETELTILGLYSLSGFVWDDVNGDGIQDADEPGLAGVAVVATESEIGLTYNTTSEATGDFSFTELPEGNYQVSFTAPEDKSFSPMDQGGDDSLDSDADPTTGMTATIALAENVETVDAGLIEEQLAGVSGVPASYCVGPTIEDFPEGYSPLTGQPVADPSLLELRPVQITASLFPPSVRPPTGLSVAPITFQYYIGQGDSRLTVTYYGEYPEILFEPELDGIESAAPSSDFVLGDHVWFDLNGNSVQDEGEPGVPRIAVTLWVDGSSYASTSTDDFGNYYFDYAAVADTASSVQLQFELPVEYADYYFVTRYAGSDSGADSDVYEGGNAEGFTEVIDMTTLANMPDFSFDAGLRRVTDRVEGTRSVRLFNEDIRQQYCACLIGAGASPEVAAQVQTCAFAASSDTSDEGASGVDIVQLGLIAEENSVDNACSNPNLAGNLYCTETTLQGADGQELFTFWNVNNQDHFVYDETLAAYTWAKNLPSDNENFEVLTDGLNGETLTFENVVVMLTTMTQENDAGTIFEMDLNHTSGDAYIFRNGVMYEATWSTLATPYEQSTGLLQPYRFLDADGNPFPFAPGQTFVQMLHTFHLFEETSPGIWRARFYAPAYP